MKVGDSEMLEKPNFDEGSFSEGNGSDFGTAPAAILSEASVAGPTSIGGGSGTPTAAEFEDGSDFRFSQGGRGGFR